jgi:hypothetical protein
VQEELKPAATSVGAFSDRTAFLQQSQATQFWVIVIVVAVVYVNLGMW